MFISIDGMARTIFFAPQVPSFSWAYPTVGLGYPFISLNFCFPSFQVTGFMAGQFATMHSLFYSMLLMLLPFIYNGGTRLR